MGKTFSDETIRKMERWFLLLTVVVSIAGWAAIELAPEPIVLSRWISVFGSHLPSWLPPCLEVVGAGAYACRFRVAGKAIAVIAFAIGAGVLISVVMRILMALVA